MGDLFRKSLLSTCWPVMPDSRCAGMIVATALVACCRNRTFGASVVNWIVCGSMTLMPGIRLAVSPPQTFGSVGALSHAACASAAPLREYQGGTKPVSIVARFWATQLAVNATSFAVKGWPSCHVTPDASLNV